MYGRSGSLGSGSAPLGITAVGLGGCHAQPGTRLPPKEREGNLVEGHALCSAVSLTGVCGTLLRHSPTL